MVTSNAPFGLLPVFSTIMANLTRSLPATFDSVASMGVVFNPFGGPDVMVPEKDEPGWPGGSNVTPAGSGGNDPVALFWVNSPFALLVDTTPLVIVSSGSATTICAIPGEEVIVVPC